MNDKLRECPFCGKIPMFNYVIGSINDCWVECKCEVETKIYESEKEAVAFWNTRSINTPKHETVEELRDLLTHMVNKSNKVTSMSRHGISSSQKSVNELYTAQLKAERFLNGKPEIEG